jgi:sterol desaturase/sphingolipid hydroxylase (fatty acid hydroxylase superfamily)
MMNPLIFIIPAFLLLMLAEHIITSRQGKSVYSFRETIGNLYCAIGQVFIEIFFKIPLIALYYFCGKYAFNLHLTGVVKWFTLFVIVDFLFWLSHMIAHRIPWMWAIHGVHHQAENYNFSVGLRMPWWHKLMAFWIVIPPAVLGFAPVDYVLVATIHASAQIWTHTTLLPKRIPIFERFFVTPSHHRVHHGKNKIYVDKNFGGILSVWDYLFDTYQPETEPVRFGIPKIKPRVNPWSSNIVQFVPRLMPKLPQHKRLSLEEKVIIAALTLVLVAGCVLVFLNEGRMTMATRAISCATVLSFMIGAGVWMDHREDWFKDVELRLLPSPRVITLLIGLLLL